MTIQPDGKHDMPSHDTLEFAFISTPIQQLFKTRSSSLSTIIKVLSVLAVRFQQTYIQSCKVNWFEPFETSLPLLEDCLSSSVTDFAEALTQTDKRLSDRRSRGTHIEEDAMLSEALIHWQRLKDSVRECCSGQPNLVPYFQNSILVRNPGIEHTMKLKFNLCLTGAL